jgi:hypothetical protein
MMLMNFQIESYAPNLQTPVADRKSSEWTRTVGVPVNLKIELLWPKLLTDSRKTLQDPTT